MATPGSPANPPAPSTSSDPVAEVAAFWDRAATNVVKMLDGTYSSDDATKDASALSTKALECGQKVIDFWSQFFDVTNPHRIPQPSSKVPCKVDDANRPLTLQTTGFRAIGYGPEYFIADADISFVPSRELAAANPPVAPPAPPLGASPELTLIVDWHHLPPDATTKTIIYEGEVIATQTGKVVTTPVRFIKPAYAD
jgi:hypothetical protein